VVCFVVLLVYFLVFHCPFSRYLFFCRCEDANLIDMPVRIEKCDIRVYHVAFFAQADIQAFEELSWDYGCTFDRSDVQEGDFVFPFHCKCGSTHCRDKDIDNAAIQLTVDISESD
jgi:SET domain-containing protein